MDDLSKLKEELYPIVKEKLENGTLDKFIRRVVVDDNGKKRTELIDLTDPAEYLEYLIEKKKMIKGDIYADEYILNAVKKEDLRMNENESHIDPKEIPEMDIASISEGSSGFSIKVKVIDFSVKQVQLKKGGATRILKVIGADGTGNCEISPIWQDIKYENIFELADENALIGKTIEVTNVYTKKNKYSPFPFVISPQKVSSIILIDESEDEVEGDIKLTDVNNIGENTPIVSLIGKIYKLYDVSSRVWENPNGKSITFTSQDFIIMGKSGSTILVKAKSKVAGHIPQKDTQVMIKFAKVIKDNWRVEKGYANPYVIEIYNKNQIEVYDDEEIEYPERAGFVGEEKDLFNSTLKKIQFIGTLSNFVREKWNKDTKEMILQPPYYISCGVNGCKKKASEIDGEYMCASGHQPTVDTIKKIFLCNATVSDYTSEYKSLISGELITPIFGRNEELLIEEADSMELENFYAYLNDQLSLEGNVFVIKGYIKINEFGAQFNINSIERISYDEAVDHELEQIDH